MRRPSIQISLPLCVTTVSLVVSVMQSLAVSTVTVFDSFGPGNTYLTTVAWGVTGASASGGYRGQAEWFVPATSGYLNTITLAIFRQSGSLGANFFIAQDSGAGTPGTILESYLNTLGPSGVLTLSSSSQPLLQAGMTYWVCAEPATSTTVNGWFNNNQNYKPGFAFERSPWAWEPVTPTTASSGAFRVEVTPVPEPSTLGLAGLFFCLLTRAFPRGRKACKLKTDTSFL